jgi:YD repeat-containing protein
MKDYQYNAIGNLVSKNGQALSYPAAGQPRPHAVTSFNGTAYTYDANGSMLSRGTQTISYDPERRPVRLAQGGQTVWRAAYDGDGVRRKRLDANGTLHYLGAYERNVGNGQDTSEVVTKYYHALGRLLAFRKNGVLRWVGTDHLGGTLRVADASFVDRQRH